MMSQRTRDGVIRFAGVLMLLSALIVIIGTWGDLINSSTLMLTVVVIAVIFAVMAVRLKGRHLHHGILSARKAFWTLLIMQLIVLGLIIFAVVTISEKWITIFINVVFLITGLIFFKKRLKFEGFLLIVASIGLIVLELIGFGLEFLIEPIASIPYLGIILGIVTALAGLLVLKGGNWLFKIFGVLLIALGAVRIINYFGLLDIWSFMESPYVSLFYLFFGVVFLLKGTRFGEQSAIGATGPAGNLAQRGIAAGGRGIGRGAKGLWNKGRGYQGQPASRTVFPPGNP